MNKLKKGLLYKKRIEIAQSGTKLVGRSNIIDSDYAPDQVLAVGNGGRQYVKTLNTVPHVDRSATTFSAAPGQRIATRAGTNPNAAPIDALRGEAPSIALIKARQINMQKAGLYDGAIDGIWGPKSEAAWQQHIRSNTALKKFWQVKD